MSSRPEVLTMAGRIRGGDLGRSGLYVLMGLLRGSMVVELCLGRTLYSVRTIDPPPGRASSNTCLCAMP
jgi:hypothetical protein